MTLFLRLQTFLGPTAVGRGKLTDEIKNICGKIVARYTVKDSRSIDILFTNKGNQETFLAEPISEDDLAKYRI